MYFKKMNNLKNNKIGIIFFGEHTIINQWRSLTESNKNFSVCHNHHQLSQYKPNENIVIYFNTNTREAVKTALRIRLKGFKVIKFWTGTDVLNLNCLSFFKKALSLFLLNRLVKLHLTNSSWLTEELHELDIKSEHWISPTPLYFIAKEASSAELAKKENIVLIYSNEGREWLYNAELMLEVAKLTPQLKFIFIGNNALNTDHLSNTESLGIVSPEKMIALYKQAHILLRVTEHDGFPRMIIEALYFGLNVIFNRPVPHTILCSKNINEIKQKLTSLPLDAINTQGREYALHEFSAHQWIKQIQQYATQIMAK